MTLTKVHFTTISGHFFANCMFIFHKTKVQTVILRCLMGLNLDWFKRYGLRCRWRPPRYLANSQKIPNQAFAENFTISKTGESSLLSISIFPITHPLFIKLLELIDNFLKKISEDSIFSVHGVKLWSEDQERRQHHLGAYSFRQLNQPSSTSSASAASNPKTNYKRSATVQQFNWGDNFFSLYYESLNIMYYEWK